MKITLAGSLGHIGRPLTETLLANGHDVSVITSNPERADEIRGLGAQPFVGRLQEIEFLKQAFEGADLAYVIAPPADYTDQNLVLRDYFGKLGEAFANSVRAAGVPRVINLSSIGAHLERGNGILEGTYLVEQSLDALPEHVAVTHVRPTEIYYNLYGQLPLIREHGILASVTAPEDTNVWVAPRDIAAVVVEEIEREPVEARRVRYAASEELTYGKLATTIGTAIGEPELPWVQIPAAQLTDSLVGAGLQPAIAAQMTEMYEAIHSGLLYEHYRSTGPHAFGPTKAADFAKEYAQAYQHD